MPLLLLQDACRLIFFARSQAKLAAANDALWAVVQAIGIAAVVWAGAATAPSLVLVWGLAAGVCVVIALFQLQVVPDVVGARSWMREHRDMSGYLLAEYLLGAGAFQGGILAVGALKGGPEGLAIVGAFRAAQVVLGPLNMLGTALQTFALPQLSRRDWLTARQRWKVALAIGGFMASVALVYSVILLLLPREAGMLMFNDSWDGARAVLLPMAIGATAGALCQGCAIVIYSLGLARRTFRIMSVEAPLVFTLMIGGAFTGGAVGAAWGMCIDQVSLVPLWFWTLRGVLRDAQCARRDAGH
jgi:O-antigen/teichoic acid export membrane protein